MKRLSGSRCLWYSWVGAGACEKAGQEQVSVVQLSRSRSLCRG